ncbi:MAG: FAD-dependent oxidoreductase [Pseudomonadota bacterium]
MKHIGTDVCVIGAGSGGLSFAAGAAQMGARVILLEGGKMGGDCLNFGCVPSKTLLAAGKQAHAMRTGGTYGVSPVMPEVSYAAVNDRIRAVIDAIAPVDSQERFEGLGVRVLRKYGTFISRTEVQAGDTVIRSRRFVIATGASAFVPPIPGLGEVPHETNETIFDLRERPEHLIIIGGGPVGVEMAQAHIRLGAKVTMLESMKAMSVEDPEAAAVVLAGLRAEGVEIAEETRIAKVGGEIGAIAVHARDGRIFRGTHLLIAAGRKANIDGLNLNAAGVAYDDAITVDAGLRTTNRRIYAIGDAAGGPRFTHVAGYHAGIVIRSVLFGLPAKQRTDHIPRVIYTDPELAQVGLTETGSYAQHGSASKVVRFNFAHNDRAIAEGRTRGFAKIMIHKGRPVGATIVGPQAGELIGIWSLAIANKLKMRAMANMVVPYPTLGEINKRVAGAYFSPKLFDNPMVKRAVGLVQRWVP